MRPKHSANGKTAPKLPITPTTEASTNITGLPPDTGGTTSALRSTTIVKQHPKVVNDLKTHADDHKKTIQALFARYEDRHFTIDCAPTTTLRARDVSWHGIIAEQQQSP